MEQIKRGNSTGSIELDDLKRPVFYYSKPLNFMKQEDRRVLFKALLFMKLMQLKYEKGSVQVKDYGGSEEGYFDWNNSSEGNIR